MRPSQVKNKFVPIIILLLLLVSSLLIFSTLYNQSIAYGTRLHLTGILISFMPFIIGLWFYFVTLKQRSAINELIAHTEMLKSQLEGLIKVQKNDQKQETKNETINIQEWANKIIPGNQVDNLDKYSETLLANIAKSVEVVQGLLFIKDQQSSIFRFTAGYAFYSETPPHDFSEGETLAGQVAKNQKLINIDNIPDGYITVLSGLGKGSPRHLIITPIVSPQSKTIGIIELASFKAFLPEHEELFTLIGRKLGEILSIS